jgi:hypothetical protein
MPSPGASGVTTIFSGDIPYNRTMSRFVQSLMAITRAARRHDQRVTTLRYIRLRALWVCGAVAKLRS